MSQPVKRGYLGVVLGLLLLATTMAILGESPLTGGNALRAGGFEDTPGLLAWDQTSVTNDSLIQQVAPSDAHGGSYIARFGETPQTTDTLDQPVGALGAYAQSATLSFYWRVENPKTKGSDVLYAELVDANSGQIIPIGSFKANTGTSEWALASFSFTPLGLGLSAHSDYLVRFEADVRSSSNPPGFEIDDASLTYKPVTASKRAMKLPISPPDPDLPPPVVDEDGDTQFESTNNEWVEFAATPVQYHSDLPNTCSCGFPSHKQITLEAYGYAAGLSDANIMLKFEVQANQAGNRATDAHVVSFVNGVYTITCTVKDSPQKNVLQTGVIKVKNTSTGEHGWTKGYTYENGVERGFRWGFPDRIADNSTVTAGASTSILGDGAISVYAPGLHAFTKCSGTVVKPVMYAKDTNGTKVHVKTDGTGGYTNNCPSDNLWTTTWTKEGAPTLCTAATPCLDISSPNDLILLNPDNIKDSGDPKYADLKRTLSGQVTFQTPPAMTFTPNNHHGPINSVGFNGSTTSPADIALFPISNATNKVTFTGSNFYRIKKVVSDNGLDYLNLVEVTRGNSLTGWAQAHMPTANAAPSVQTKDNPNGIQDTTSLPVLSSFAADTGSSSCLASRGATACTFTDDPPIHGGEYDIDHIIVGPTENTGMSATPVNCQPMNETVSCSDFTLFGTVNTISYDSQNRPHVVIHLSDFSTALGGWGMVKYQLPIVVPGYGAISTWTVKLWR